MRLTVSRDFFVQFASKTWLSPFSIIRELVEDCYDEDATRVIITLGGDYAVVEDDVGMDRQALEKFLVVGSIHKQFDPVSPKFGRPRTGRYGTGRLSFLAFFKAMKVRTRKGGFSASLLLDEECIAGLAAGSSQAKTLDEPSLMRDGSEIWLLQPKSTLDVKRILRELKDLPMLREPLFEVWVRIGEFKPWSTEGAVKVEPPEIVGEKVPVSIEGITGEITVASRPLSEEERGIAVLHGGHMVARSLFGFSPSQMSRITGYVRCDQLTVRFADKAGIIEDEAYEKFKGLVRKFISSEVLPKAAEAEDFLSYIEVQSFRTIDKVLSKVILIEEAVGEKLPEPPQLSEGVKSLEEPVEKPLEKRAVHPPETTAPAETPQLRGNMPQDMQRLVSPPPPAQPPLTQPPSQSLSLPAAKVNRLPPVPKRMTLHLGYQVVPYASEDDEREYFVDGKTIFVNKKHPAYVKELKKGRDFLVRHMLRVIASVLAAAECPDSTAALERANKLIARALEHLN